MRCGLAALTGLTSLGAVLRFAALGRQPFWLDEATSAAFATRPLFDCLFAEINHPPLYSVLLWVISRIVGNESDLVLRLPSALCGVGAIPVAWWVTVRLVPGDRRLRLVTTAFVACSPFFVALSQEARSYSLYLLLGLLSTLAFLRFVDRKTRPSPWGIALYGATARALPCRTTASSEQKSGTCPWPREPRPKEVT